MGSTNAATTPKKKGVVVGAVVGLGVGLLFDIAYSSIQSSQWPLYGWDNYFREMLFGSLITGILLGSVLGYGLESGIAKRRK